MIEIACCIDNNFTIPCGVTLTSICENNIDEDIRFHIISNDLLEQNRFSLENIAKKYSKKISFYNIDASTFSGFPISHHIKIATYFRILLPLILSDTITKVLYLDCDLLVRGALKEIWEQNIENYAVGSVRDAVNNDIRYYNRLQYDVRKGYFNAGVLLINLGYWRENNISMNVLKYIREFPERCMSWDQDALNYILQDAKKWLPLKYNVQTLFYNSMDTIPFARCFWAELEVARRMPLILHYTCGGKPWMVDCNHPYRDEYTKYLAMTEWRTIKVSRSFLSHSIRSLLRRILEKMNILPVKVSSYEQLPSFLEDYK